jgi:hypothetical protein
MLMPPAMATDQPPGQTSSHVPLPPRGGARFPVDLPCYMCQLTARRDTPGISTFRTGKNER